MHPRTDQTQNYNIIALAQAGALVLGRAGRWPNNDVSTIHETLLLDVAAGIRLLKDEGCETVILLGNSGGSSLAAFYQAQAETAPPGRLTETPAGDPLDLNGYDLPAADGVVIVAGHVGQGLLIGKLLDPSVTDESDPLGVDPSLDLYNPDNGFKLPPESSSYAPEFLERFYAAQQERSKRLDETARALIQSQRDGAARGGLEGERAARAGYHMVIYRTAADPAFVDLSIEPDDRPIASYFSKRPDLENFGEGGFARYLTPRAWLSTWSPNASNARTIDNLAQVSAPLLVVHYAGDVGTRMSEVEEMVAVHAGDDSELRVVRGVDHYGFILAGPDEGRRSAEGPDIVVAWLRERFALSN